MSKVDMSQFGLDGIEYVFMGKIRYFQNEEGDQFKCFVFPTEMPVDKRQALAEFIGIDLQDLDSALIEFAEAMEAQPKPKQRGTEKHVDLQWEHVVDLDAKGNPKGLRHDLIGKLLAPEYIRVDDILMKSTNNIAISISKDSLIRDILNRLTEVKAADQWGTKSYVLVRDHLMSYVESKTVGQTAGHLPVKNGVIDLRTLELIQTDNVYLSCADVEYDPQATCPNVEKLLNNAFLPEQKELVLSILGAALSGKRAPFILCLSGRGRNGKSILREMVTRLASSMITTEKLESLHDNFSNQVFLGKRIIWQTEVSSKRDFTDKLKDVTGGTSLTVRYKYQNGQIQQEMQSVVIIDTNNPPHLEDSQAINDRLRFIDMPRVFVYELSGASNEVLIDPVLAEAWVNEMPGFLNLILPYAQFYLTQGHLKQDYKVGMEKYNEKSEALSIFIDKWCDVSEGEEVSITTFCKYYKKFAVKNNVSAVNDGSVRHQLQREYGLKVKGMKVYGIRPKIQAILENFGSSDDKTAEA